jgi:hypothetical protein
MKRVVILATVALLALMMMAPAAMAQDDTTMMMEETTMMMEDTSMGMEDTDMEGTTSGMQDEGDLPESGGPALLLPAAALLLGSGILTFAVLRRR